MDVVARINNPERNAIREVQQGCLIAQYNQHLDLGMDIHLAMTLFTRQYIQSYFPEKPMDIRFLAFDYADNDILKNARGWLAAREIVGGNELASAKDHEWKDPNHLYRDCAMAAKIM